jgi:hypothetical protein
MIIQSDGLDYHDIQDGQKKGDRRKFSQGFYMLEKKEGEYYN